MLKISRRARNRIALLILIPAVAYGAARVIVWYSVKEAVGRARESLSPAVSLSYARVLSPVFGPIGVTGIALRPRGFNDRISIGSALVHISNPLDKVEFLHTVMGRRLPTRFDLSLNDVEVPLSGDIVAWLDRKSDSGEPAGGVPLACGSGASVTAADIKKMGYDELAGNVVLHYVYDRRTGGLVAYAKLVLQDMIEATFEGTIPASEVVFNVDQVTGIPRFSQLSVSLRDLSWASRFNRYCARAMGITVSDYIQKRLADTRAALESADFEPSDELMKGLQKFATGKTLLTVSLDPQDPISLAQLDAKLGSTYLLDTLGMKVSFDGRQVKDLGKIKTARATQVDKATQQQPREETYKPTPVRELPQFLERQVRVLMSNGDIHRGYLDSIDAEKMVLTQHLVGGSATFDVELKGVAHVLVLRP